MKTILHIDCSPRGEDAESHKLAEKIIDILQKKAITSKVDKRVIGDGSIPHVDKNYAISQGSVSDVSNVGSMRLSEELITELEDAEIVVISTPMHNLSIPSSLKAWIDHVVRARRTFNVTASGKIGLLKDKPIYLAIASGGKFSGEQARQPDFLTPYLKFILGSIGFSNVTFFSVQGTGGKPEMIAAARSITDKELHSVFGTIVS